MIFGVSANACSLYPSHRGTWVMNSSTPLLPSFIFSFWKKRKEENKKKSISIPETEIFSLRYVLRQEERKNLEYISRMNVVALVRSTKSASKMFSPLFLLFFFLPFLRFVKWRRLKNVKGKGNCHKSSGYLFLWITRKKAEKNISLSKITRKIWNWEKEKFKSRMTTQREREFRRVISTFKRLENFS